MTQPVATPVESETVPITVKIPPRHITMLQVVGRRIATPNNSAATRYIFEEWARLSGYSEWNKEEQSA